MAAPNEPKPPTLSLSEQGDWREMVRLFLDRGEPLGVAIRFADEYITAARARQQKPDPVKSFTQSTPFTTEEVQAAAENT